MTKAHRIILQAPRDYATKANAIKAVEAKYGPDHPHFGSADVRYVVVQGENGRWFPLFIGNSALNSQVHSHFNVAA